jgi:hypothetical protein
MFLRAYRAAELWVIMVRNNIEMDIKEIELMTSRMENKLISIQF